MLGAETASTSSMSNGVPPGSSEERAMSDRGFLLVLVLCSALFAVPRLRLRYYQRQGQRLQQQSDELDRRLAER